MSRAEEALAAAAAAVIARMTHVLTKRAREERMFIQAGCGGYPEFDEASRLGTLDEILRRHYPDYVPDPVPDV